MKRRFMNQDLVENILDHPCLADRQDRYSSILRIGRVLIFLTPIFTIISPKEFLRDKCLIVLILLFSCLGCRKGTPPEQYVPSIELTLEQASTAEVRLKVALLDSHEPRQFQVTRDSQTILNGYLSGRDTIVSDKDVQQTESYIYKAYRVQGTSFLDSSNGVQVTLGHGWRVDTLIYPGIGQLTLSQLWGVSSNELFAVGHNSDGYRTIWKWDGTRWSIFQPLPRDAHSLVNGTEGIWGTSPNSFWVVGRETYSIYDTTVVPPVWRYPDSAFIGYWNGSTWTKQDIHGGRTLFYVWGSSESDIYAGGRLGSLYHFDGATWTKLSNDTTMDFGKIWGRNASEVYGIGRRFDTGVNDTTFWYLISFSSSSYTIVDSTVETFGSSLRFGIGGIWGTETSTYSWYRGVYKKTGNYWTLVFDIPYPLGAVRGLSDTNLYAVGAFRAAYHFDGTAWRTIDGFPFTPLSFSFFDIWLDERELFFLATDGWRSYVYHYK